MMFAAAYGLAPPSNMNGMASYPMGFYTPQATGMPSYTSPPYTLQQKEFPVSPFSSPSTSSPMEQDFNPYFATMPMPHSSSQLQSVTGTASYSQPIPAPLQLEPLQTPALSSSLSSPTLSVSSSSGSLLTPMSECFSELHTPLSSTFPATSVQDSCAASQVHFHDFTGGLELYHVPCAATSTQGISSSNIADEIAMMVTDTPAPSAQSSSFSSPEHLLLPLPSNFTFASTLESAVASSTLAGALA